MRPTAPQRTRLLAARGRRHARAALAGLVALLAIFAVDAAAGGSGPEVSAQTGPAGALTGTQVLAGLRAAGLDVSDARKDPIAGSPSSVPASETEAWSFSVHGSALRHGGRIMVFADDRLLQQKAAWFRRAGAEVIAARNVLLWLDPSLSPQEVARYRQALEQVR